MPNTTLKISLPSELRTEVEHLAKEQHHTLSGYVQQLFRNEINERRDKIKLRSILVDAMNSESKEMTIGELEEKLLSRIKNK